MKSKPFIINNNEYSSSDILIKKKSIKKMLLEREYQESVKIAFLIGSTVNEIVDDLELFLLNEGIKPEFYISDLGNYINESLFPTTRLKLFNPDFIIIHTSYRNLVKLPSVTDSLETINKSLELNKAYLSSAWDSLLSAFEAATIIQNNYDFCYYRLLGNLDSVDYRGINNFIIKMNTFISEAHNGNKRILVNDLNYIQAKYGIESFSDPRYWYSYKYAMNVNYVPYYSYNVFTIIKSVLGKNKKVLNLDLDNTLWGGVVGDDGVDNISINNDSPEGEYFHEFQKYLLELRKRGVLLTINSKNNHKIALEGLKLERSVLHEDDFVDTKINWETKINNITNTSRDLNISLDFFVFVDDNQIEREIIKTNSSITILNYESNALIELDASGYFEPTFITYEDFSRTQTYNQMNFFKTEQMKYANYNDFLQSLDMRLEIGDFSPKYFERIAQLLNKTNQFNVTTNRVTKDKVEKISKNKNNICLYAILKDKYVDYGLISCIIGEENDNVINITNWVMSCRVFSRGVEYALFNTFVDKAAEKNTRLIEGYYNKTDKNLVVKDLYNKLGFSGHDQFYYIKPNEYTKKYHTITILFK